MYRYFEVPAEEHCALMAAESKGEYLKCVFKPKRYCYTLVRNGHNELRSAAVATSSFHDAFLSVERDSARCGNTSGRPTLQ